MMSVDRVHESCLLAEKPDCHEGPADSDSHHRQQAFQDCCISDHKATVS